MIIDVSEYAKSKKLPSFKKDEFNNILLRGGSRDTANAFAYTLVQSMKLSSEHYAVYAVSFDEPSTEEAVEYGKSKDYLKRIKTLNKTIKDVGEDKRKIILFLFGLDYISPKWKKGYKEISKLLESGQKGGCHVIAVSLFGIDPELEKFFKE